jgi:hypothetical protein
MAVNLIGPAGVKPAGVAALWLGVIGGYQFHPDGKIQPAASIVVLGTSLSVFTIPVVFWLIL